MRGKRMQLIGRAFGKLKVIAFSGYRGNHPRPSYWLCECRCGRRKIIRGQNLLRGRTKSCGCSTYDWCRTHGMRNHPDYALWVEMRRRCSNPNRPGAETYFARGIRVCRRWQGRNGFANFIRDMGARPSKLHTIERINNRCGYFPNNCRWATDAEQNRNRTDTVRVRYRGKTMCASEFARIINVGASSVRRRLNRGETPECIAKVFRKRGPLGRAYG